MSRHLAQADAVVLVNPNGTPIGGQWQQWADVAKVPTLAGSLTIVSNAALGCTASSCSESPNLFEVESDGSLASSPLPVLTGFAPTVSQWDFYYELGHQFDWAYLSADDRTAFLDAWGISQAQWWDTAAGLASGYEDGAEAVFAGTYAACALGWSIVPGVAGFPQAPQITPSQDTCVQIDEIGRRVGADMPDLAPTVSATIVSSSAPPRPARVKILKASKPERRRRKWPSWCS